MHCSSLIHSRADFYFSLLFSLEGSGNKTTAPCGNAWALQRHNKYTVLQLTTYESTSYPVRVGTRLNLHDLVPSPFHVSFSIFSFPIPMFWITPAPTKVMGIATSFFRLLHVSVRVASGTRPGNYIIMEVLETWVLTSMDGKYSVSCCLGNSLSVQCCFGTAWKTRKMSTCVTTVTPVITGQVIKAVHAT